MIRARVQHHPARAHLLPRLLAALDPIPTEVITHQSVPPDPWAGYKACLTDPPDCDHLLIVQDDAVPVPGFAEVLPDRVSVLAQIAERAEDIDEARAEAAKRRADEQLAKAAAMNDEDYERARLAAMRALARLQVSRHIRRRG